MIHFQLMVARKERGLQQKQLAKILHIDPVTYHRKENGKSDFTLTEAFTLSEMFEIPVDDLFSKRKKGLANAK